MQKFSDKKQILAIYHEIYAFSDKDQNCPLVLFTQSREMFRVIIKTFSILRSISL